jgi:hypothetical protein
MIDSLVSFDSKLLDGASSSRRQIWTEVYSRIISHRLALPSHEEDEKLRRLTTCMSWIDMVDPQWIEIYGALFEESRSFQTSPIEKMKIDKDIHRTFGLFFKTSAGSRVASNLPDFYKSLETVLVATSHETGYCQGINFIAASLLVGLDRNERSAFILLSYLLRQRHLNILFNAKCSSLLEYMNMFSKKLRRTNKKMYTHFKRIGFGPVCYSIEWFTTCFIVTCPGDLSCCVIDMLLLGFDDIMIRVGLAVVEALESDIEGLDLEELQMCFKKLTMALTPQDILPRALTIDIGSGKCILDVRMDKYTHILGIVFYISSPFPFVICTHTHIQMMAWNVEQMNPQQEMVDTLRFKGTN